MDIKYNSRRGFTIVELLVVIIVIAILAAVTIVAYNGVSNRAKASSAQSAAETASKKVQTYMTTNADQAPADLATAGITDSGSTTFQYSKDATTSPQTFCITATTSGVSYYIDNITHTNPTAGACSGHINGGAVVIANGSYIQTITSANCPATRTRAVDARDSHTYWVQKLADGKCWMLTNLAYAGGGTNTYGDVKALTNGTGGSSTYTTPMYYVATGSNPTTEPTAPSASTDGGATNPQYGYLYNWCAALGGQATTACIDVATPAANATVSVCPAGWRLPTGSSITGELTLLNNAVNSGSTNSDAGLRTNWLAQYGGTWNNGFSGLGSLAYYWSSSLYSSTSAYDLYFYSFNISPANGLIKTYGAGVRCVAV